MFRGHRLNGPTWPSRPTGLIPESGRAGPPTKLQTNSQYGKEKPVSTALWCDTGQHAFSAKDEERRHFTQTKTVTIPTGNSYGKTVYQQRQEVTEELDICGPCYAKTSPFRPAETPALAELEAEKDSYEQGFEAGESHANYTKTHPID